VEKINYKPGIEAMANATVDLEKNMKLCDQTSSNGS